MEQTTECPASKDINTVMKADSVADIRPRYFGAARPPAQQDTDCENHIRYEPEQAHIRPHLQISVVNNQPFIYAAETRSTHAGSYKRMLNDCVDGYAEHLRAVLVYRLNSLNSA